ncbi:hypothetical protein RND81_04G102800 [Saponaria officinalis]|uniref:F-box domain-containing protein n=1 Tax=Saponaria officinalis TaxID=3572 RepID=A0AAW1LDI6_SAPOF
MDWKSKTCSRKKLSNANADRLTSLPDELLCRILCMLPTKDAAATLVLSKRMRKAFSWITTFDLDDSPISRSLPKLPSFNWAFSSF